MAEELCSKIRTLEVENDRQNHEILALKTEIVALKTENDRQNHEIAALKTENNGLHAKVDELIHSMEFLIKKYNELDKRTHSEETAGTSTKEANITHQRSSAVPMAGLHITPSPSELPVTVATTPESLEDKFAKLPADRLAAEMWKSAMENLTELSGPATVDLLEKQLDKFGGFVTSVSSKQNFCDAVKKTCIERGFSNGISRKMLKLLNKMSVDEDA